MKPPIWIAVCVSSLIFSALLPASGTYGRLSTPSGSHFKLAKGVVVDPDRGVVYVMNPEHGINAIEIASGNFLWRTSSAAEPLLVFDESLVAQAEASEGNRVLPIAILNATDGKLVQSVKVPLAASAFASIDEGMGTSFIANASLSGGEIEVSWRFRQGAVLARPGPEQLNEIDGVAWIDLKTGIAKAVAPRTMAQGRATKMPASLQKLVDSGTLATSPQFVGRFYIVSTSTDGEHRVTVRRWDADSGRELASIELEPGFNMAIASADEQTLLANKPAGTDATGWTDYLWAIYSLQTCERLGEIRMPTSAAPFFLWNSILVYVSRPYGRRIDGKWVQEPLELCAIELRSNREAWKIPIRDTAYHGPFPSTP